MKRKHVSYKPLQNTWVTRIAISMLKVAFKDMRSGGRLQKDVLKWINNDNNAEGIDFGTCCMALHLRPEAVKDRLMKKMPWNDRWLDYW